MIYNIGMHKVRHGNIYEAAQVEEFVGEDRADIFYSDPPWGPGNLKYWDTINKKMNPDAKSYEFGFDVDRFLETVLRSAKKFSKGFVVIEYGKRWTHKVENMGKAFGLYYCGTVEVLYDNAKRPLDVVFFHVDEPKDLDLSSVYHTAEYTTVKTIFGLLGAKEGGTGMDLCCGLGYSARACIDFKMKFIGNELNKKRLEKTMAKLSKNREGK